ncbi:GNAT family N-acetyltransferase [Cohnella terricola]|uniref:GNAT family N-acetyltransferase n=1 Tax=Cohnella terricola TaxID=1289167 RepID=A0A559J587_9BACL|nr:GNAT family N-acetyltransferase [Cohnella terricola]TVX95011.1 GNAT family N-acetyltransferase [Cohnella terricola]
MQAPAIPPLTLEPMTEQDGRDICDWRYPEPYDLFRWPPWDAMVEQGREFGDPEIRQRQYLSVRIEGQPQLVGYVQLFPMDRAVRIGMGLRPDCCDRGWGAFLAGLVVREAERRKPGAEIDLEVEKWNKRAIRAYEKAGFVVTDAYDRRATHGIVSVLCMVWHKRRDPFIKL